MKFLKVKLLSAIFFLSFSINSHAFVVNYFFNNAGYSVTTNVYNNSRFVIRCSITSEGWDRFGAYRFWTSHVVIHPFSSGFSTVNSRRFPFVSAYGFAVCN